METDLQKLIRVKDFLITEMDSHKKSGNDSEVEEIHDLIVDLEDVMERLA